MLRIAEDRIIYRDDNYNSFPSLARMADGRIIAVFRQADNSLRKYGKVTHVDPSSRVVAVFSSDEGRSWSRPSSVYDDEMGEQDPCVTSLADGSLICTFFRWRVVPIKDKALLGEAYKYYGRDIFDRWSAVHVGTACVRSADCGATWEGPYHFPGAGFQGPLALRGNVVELPGGRLLAPLYGAKRFGELSRCVVMGSDDGGRAWAPAGEVPGSPNLHFLEPFLYRAPSGRLDILMRSQADWKGVDFDTTYRNLHAASSLDGGATWSTPAPTGLFCPNPIHLLPLGDGRALASFGQRRDPKGIQFLVVDAEHPRLDDSLATYARRSADGDLGYTSALRLKDGSVLVAYYMTDEESRAYIGATALEDVKDAR
jgi:Predicted neuraminidase (sialidase)